MKWILGLVFVVGGSTLGGSVAYFRDRDPGDDYRALLEMAEDAKAPERVVSSRSLPDAARLEIENGREFDFGVMDINEKRKHTFLVRNTGSSPLTLELIRTTCKCAIGELPDGAIAPGELGEVALDWTAKGYQREFRQSATIETNDPENPLLILSVYGRVIKSVAAIPSSLTLGDSTASDNRAGVVTLLGYKDPEMKIDSYEWIAPDNADFLDVEIETGEVYDDAMVAHDISVRLKPGMPHGKFNETLLLKLSSAPKRIEIPVTGRIVSDIAIVGRNYREKSGILRVGVIQKAVGGRAKLMLLVKGPHREDVKFEIDSINPEGGLEVEFGEPTSYQSVVKVPLEIVVPKGLDPVQRRASDDNPARIVFRTSHPDIETVELLVSYAITE